MADLTTTQLKLRTTPTAGVSSEQSPYYRRLVSAGYKGFLNGTVGGATLYGVIGAGIGTLVALPLLFVPGVAPVALSLIPAMAGIGLYKGASTFGNIGSFAAITAESAEMSEKRRYLLDRYYDLPDTPEFDNEAAQIRDLLTKQHESKAPESMFHLRPVLVGAAIGIGAALLLMTPVGSAFVGHIFLSALEVPVLTGGFGLAQAAAMGVGAILGGASGAMVGLDRYYVRNWLDKSASAMHDSHNIEQQIREREQEIEKLGERSTSSPAPAQATPDTKPTNPSMKITIADAPQAPQRDVEQSHPHGSTRQLPIDPQVIAGLDEAPASKILASEAQLHARVSAREHSQAVT